MSSTYPVETFETTSYGLGVPQPYPFGIPEQLPRSVVNPALAASFVAMVGAGRLYGVTVTNTKGASQFFQLFDIGSLPSNGAVPIISVDIAASTTKAVFWGTPGRWMDRGIVFANSSTQGSLTLGSADCLFDVQYTPQVI